MCVHVRVRVHVCVCVRVFIHSGWGQRKAECPEVRGLIDTWVFPYGDTWFWLAGVWGNLPVP